MIICYRSNINCFQTSARKTRVLPANAQMKVIFLPSSKISPRGWTDWAVMLPPTSGAALLCSTWAGSDIWLYPELINLRCVDLPAPCYLNNDKVFLLLSDQYCNTKWGIQTWVLSLQLCLNIVDNLNHSATMAGLQMKVIIETKKFNFAETKIFSSINAVWNAVHTKSGMSSKILSLKELLRPATKSCKTMWLRATVLHLLVLTNKSPKLELGPLYSYSCNVSLL